MLIVNEKQIEFAHQCVNMVYTYAKTNFQKIQLKICLIRIITLILAKMNN